MAELTIDQAIAVGIQCFDQGLFADAEQWFRGALKADPGNAEAMYRLGVVLIERKQHYEALYRLQRAAMITRSAPILSNLGMVLGELGHHDEAIPYIQRAARLQPENPVIWNNLGNMFIYRERFVEAIEALDKALNLDPRHGTSHYNKGMAYVHLGDYERGLKHINDCLTVDPENADALFQRGICRLTLGDFGGFEDYEYRWCMAGYDPCAQMFPYPKWLGHEADLTGKSIVIYGDQGLGDLLFFGRYIPMIVRTGAKVYAALHGPLKELFQATFPDIQTTGEANWDAVDYRLPLPTAPLAFGTTPDTIPPPVKFHVPEELIGAWRGAIDSPHLRVGVCWSGNFQHINDKDRSMSFKAFSYLLDCCAKLPVTFYSLQAEPRQSDRLDLGLRRDLINLDIRTFSDTAAILESLDLVVCVDTSVAHLAASQGIATMVLLPKFRGDWRWGLTSNASAWYPSMRLVRQQKRGDWQTVLRQVASQIEFSCQQKQAA